MNFNKKINFHVSSKWVFLLILITIVSIIAYCKIKLQMKLGPISDTYDLLANAALFAGQGIGYSDLTRPPFLSVLTSIFFIFDGLSTWPIFVIDSVLYVFGCIGLYLLFKERFDSSMSFLGSLLFATFPIVLTFAGIGYNDVSGVAIAIWAIFLTHMAVNKNSKFFLLSFPIAMLAFLTRYNMALIIFPIFLYILINRSKIKSFKNIIIGIILSLLILIPLFLFFNAQFGNPIYPFISFFQTSGGSSYTEHFAYNLDFLYYIKNLPLYIGSQSALIIGFTVLGFILYLFKNSKYLFDNKSWNLNLKKFKMSPVLVLLALSIIFLATFGKVHYMLSEVIFFFLAYLTFLIMHDQGIDFDMDLFYFSWFMAFFIFQSVYPLKDHRYFITMYPPIAYFMIRGLDWAAIELKKSFKGKNIIKYFIIIVLTSMMIFSTFTQISTVEEANEDLKLFNQEAEQASNWLINHDPNYRSKIIYADFASYFAWHLRMNVGKMPLFKNNQTLYAGGTRDLNFTQEDRLELDKELERLHPDYYISVWTGMNYTSYTPLKRIGIVTILKKK